MQSPPPQPPGRSHPGRGRSPAAARGHHGPAAVHSGTGLPHGHVPAYLPGSASLVEELDEKLMIVLRDGKHIVGTLASYDQFSNMVLHSAVERRMVIDDDGVFYADIPLGLYVVRGDSMVLMGAMGNESVMTEIDLEELEERQAKSKREPLEWDFDADLVA